MRRRALEAVAELARREPVALPVRGSSMEPLLAEGDRVWVAPRRFYWPGDVVAFAVPGGRVVAHRVLGYRVSGYRLRAHRIGGRRWALVTRGDAVSAPDGPVDPARVVGRVVAVAGPAAGTVPAVLPAAMPVPLGRRLWALGRFIAWLLAGCRRRARRRLPARSPLAPA